MRKSQNKIGALDKCVRCGSAYVRTHGRQRYCSADCKRLADGESRTDRYRVRPFTCRRCGRQFTRDGSSARQVYCSDECRLDDDRDRRSTFSYERKQSPEHIAKRTAAMLATLASQVRVCERCGNEFTPTSAPQRYCSGQCWNAVAAAKRGPRNRPKVSRVEFGKLLAEQGGLCAICREPNRSGNRLATDHDHKTGGTRGLLCHRCNTAIGLFRDDADLLRAAIRYLTNYE